MINQNVVSIDRVRNPKSDLFVASCGYETRSRYIAQSAISKLNLTFEKSLAIDFESKNHHSYEDNNQFFSELGTHLVIESEFLDILSSKVDSIIASDPPIRIDVDLSSMRRSNVAQIFEIILKKCENQSKAFDLVLHYAVASYKEGNRDLGPIRYNGPVTNFFSGLSFNVQMASAIIMGLGYESDIALGVIEDLEPQRVVLFSPTGFDQKFDHEVKSNNKTLIEKLPDNSIQYYNLPSPLFSYGKLLSFVSGIDTKYRVTLIPFGPKIFSAMCLLVSIATGLKVPVWRISPIDPLDPVDIEASGDIVSLAVQWRPFPTS